MAIQFRCPQCQALIRVPDAAAGQQGNCPHCELTLIVPQIQTPPGPISEPPTSAPMPATPSPPIEESVDKELNEYEADPITPRPVNRNSEPASSESPPVVEPPPRPVESNPINLSPNIAAGSLPNVPEPSFTSPGVSENAEVPLFDPSAAPIAPAGPFIAARFKKSRHRGGAGGWISISFIAAFLASTWYIYSKFGPSLEGELRAVVATDDQLQTAEIERSTVAVPQETFEAVVQDLTDSPKRLRSRLTTTEFRGLRGALHVSVRSGSAAEVFQVTVHTDPALSEYLGEKAKLLDRPRRAMLEEATKQFFIEWEQSMGGEGSLSDLAAYRDDIALNSLVGALGYHVVAVVGSKAYRCVYEDLDGRLYFLLPRGTRTFQLQGRSIGDGPPQFPGNYRVAVSEAK